MNVLSLFDGMSCGRIALDRLGVKVDNYYASEIDKYAIEVSKANYPEIIQVGDITELDLSTLPKIDLIMGGSPCQGFSFAGKQLAFDDPRSMLFFEFVKCVETLKPKYFLLENVRMKKEYLDVISEYMGVEPIFINSSLVSAQSRQRYYWTNIPNVELPEERGIVLRDILEDQPKKPTLMSNKFVARNGDRNCMIDKNKEKAHNLSAMEYVKNGRQGNYLACDEKGIPKHKPVKQTERNRRHLKQLDDKSLCMTATMYKGAGNNGMTLVPQQIGTAVDVNGHDILKRVYSPEGKSPTVNTCQGGNREPKVVCGRYVGRYKVDGVRQDHKGSIAGKSKQMLELRRDDKTNNISTVQKDNVLVKDDVYWRKLTPLECERLQTVPDNYTNHVSNTQRYKMLGNGWTIEVITHILSNMEA